MRVYQYILFPILIGGLLWGVDKARKAASAVNVGTRLIVDAANFSLNPLSMNLVLTNTVKDTLKITTPIVELFIGESSVAYSQPDTKIHTLQPLSTMKVRIRFRLKQSSLLSLLKLVNQPISANYSLYANTIPYRDTIILKA